MLHTDSPSIVSQPALSPPQRVPIASRLLRAGAGSVVHRIDSMLQRLRAQPPAPDPLATWRGTLENGAAVGRDGMPRRWMSDKYHDELAYWKRVSEGTEASFDGELHEVFGRWQRTRLYELAGRLGLERPFAPGEAISGEAARWCAQRRALEIGGGPHPAVCEARWRSAVAVDPLADGYAAEGLLPAADDRVTHLAAPGEAIPLASRTIDLVIIENCLDHVVDPWKVLSEMKRLLVPQGHLWLLLDLMHHRDHLHPHPFTEASARAMLDRAGFEMVRCDVWDEHSHPEAFGQLRALLRRPE